VIWDNVGAPSSKSSYEVMIDMGTATRSLSSIFLEESVFFHFLFIFNKIHFAGYGKATRFLSIIIPSYDIID
jgi:hypothetical protein